RLLEECELEAVEANRAERRAAKIEQLVALGWALAGQQIRLIVTVQMVLVGPLAELHALEQFISDVRVARGGHERGEPIEAGEDTVLDGARLDLSWPADNGGHAEAALPHRAFGVLERRHAAIPPRGHLRAIVPGEDDDPVVCLPAVVPILHQSAA